MMLPSTLLAKKLPRQIVHSKFNVKPLNIFFSESTKTKFLDIGYKGPCMGVIQVKVVAPLALLTEILAQTV